VVLISLIAISFFEGWVSWVENRETAVSTQKMMVLSYFLPHFDSSTDFDHC